jgi:hypothetical protein
VSEQNQPRLPQVRIVHRPDGTAEVNGVTVWPEPGGDVRDAAYAAAVALVANSPGPVLAASVEADGTVYPLTLYPSRFAFPPEAPDAAPGRSRRSRSPRSSRSSRWAGSGGLGLGLLRRGGNRGASGTGSGGAAGGSRLTRLTLLPTLRLGWLLTAVIGCVLVAVMAAVLIERDSPSLVRLSVDQQNQDVGSAQPQDAATQPDAAHAARRGLGRRAPGETGGAIDASGPGAQPPAGPSGMASSGGAGAAAPGAEPSAAPTAPAEAPPAPPSNGVSPTPDTQPAPPGSTNHPKPTPTGPLAVSNLTLVLVGGNKSEPDVDFLMTVSANGPGPVTLTYSYAGKRGGPVVTRRLTLSGETDYAVPGQIVAKPYCGQTVTMRAATSPTAANGVADASATPGC